MVKLSVLDQSTSSTGQSDARSIQSTVELAKVCEKLGYSRFWVSEHHNHPTISGSAPEVLMAAITQVTSSIRIGSAGIMLPHYAPLKIAEQFRVLEALAPNRIDLGIGRAPGSDGKTAYALNPNTMIDSQNFPANTRDLISWVSGRPLIEGHPFEGLKAYPQVFSHPEIWMLGTSDFGAELAAYLGIPYCFAHFITDGNGADHALKRYKKKFRPSNLLKIPKTSICVWALAAETRELAIELFSSRAHWKIQRARGHLSPIISPEKIEYESYSSVEKNLFEEYLATSIVGSAEEVKAGLLKLEKEYQIDEIGILTWTYDQMHKQRSYELIADAFQLSIT